MLKILPYIAHFKQIWEESPTWMPEFKKAYSVPEQLQKEQYFDEFQKKVNGLRSKRNREGLRKKDPAKTFFPVFKSFLHTVFDFEQEQLEIILSDRFKNVSRDFFYEAREFGPELSPENIYQGLRNVWIMNGLQLMMNIPVEITPSIFGYSMIYPYSDNFLDDPTISNNEKKQFSDRFDTRLHGISITPQNNTEIQLFKLVEMFENQYPRQEFTEVYESLYAIQKGQTHSLSLNSNVKLSDSEILKICFEKGGASVLADGYLVAGRLTKIQEQALFGYGIYLQLLDDIQDVKEDMDASTRTMFSCSKEKKMNEFVSKTIHFGRSVLNEMNCFNNPGIETFLDLMKRSIETMIIESVGLNQAYYSSEYLLHLEKFSPLRFGYVLKKKDQTRSQRFELFQKYFKEFKPIMV